MFCSRFFLFTFQVECRTTVPCRGGLSCYLTLSSLIRQFSLFSCIHQTTVCIYIIFLLIHYFYCAKSIRSCIIIVMSDITVKSRLYLMSRLHDYLDIPFQGFVVASVIIVVLIGGLGLFLDGTLSDFWQIFESQNNFTI